MKWSVMNETFMNETVMDESDMNGSVMNVACYEHCLLWTGPLRI